MAVDRLGRCYAPNGSVFVPLGVNGSAAPGGPGPNGGGSFWTNQMTYMNGYSTEYTSSVPIYRGGRWRIGWGCNFLRLNTGFTPQIQAVYSSSDILSGLWSCVDEYLAAGVAVCASDHSWTCDDVRPNGTSYSPPTFDQLMADSFFRSYFDGWIDRYASNPNAWLYPLNEAYRDGPADLIAWHATGTALYNYARNRGFQGIFVWDLPGWAQRISHVNTAAEYSDTTGARYTTNILNAFLMDKTNTILGWHMYDPGTLSQMTDWATQCVENAIPIIVSEVGYGNSYPLSGPALGNMRTDEEVAWAWGTSFGNGADAAREPLGFLTGFGYGFVAWQGSGNRSPGWTIMATPGASMFENDLGATNPLDTTVRTSGGGTDTVRNLVNNGQFSLAEINFYLSNPAYGPWTVTAGAYPDVANMLNPAGYALLELTNMSNNQFFGGGGLWIPANGRGMAGGYGVAGTSSPTGYFIT